MDDPTFRTFPTEIVPCPGGAPYAVTRCEELDPETGRWEPFCVVRPVT